MKKIVIDGKSLTLPKAKAIATGFPIVMPVSVKRRVESSRQTIEAILKNAQPVYGVNTGFGYLANRSINKEQQVQLQHNLLQSHAAGHGAPLSISETRLAMALRLNVLVKGYTGVRYALCEALYRLINAEVYPEIPEYGSVGASGDLAPLAHLALPLIGKGWVSYQGKRMRAAQALKKARLQPIELAEKEALGLVNGTQIMLAVGGLALAQGNDLVAQADLITAMTYEALNASPDPLHPLIHEARKQQGQIISAQTIMQHLKGSYLFTAEKMRVQDPYSLRCAPQVHGASRDALQYACNIVEKELNAVTDNPLVFGKTVVSGGNFHGQPLAMAFDIAAMGLAEIGNISERRLELMLNPHLNNGLPAFLVQNEGVNSGYMALQYLSASLVNENKLLAMPACTDSIPGNVGIEDHVSMGMTSARKLRQIVTNVRAILATEMLAAAQAIDLRGIKKLGRGTGKLYRAIRKVVPMLKKDRIVSDDVEKVVTLLGGIK